MSETLLSLLFGLIATTGFGVGDFLIGRASRSIKPLLAALIVNTYSFLIYAAMFLIFFHDHLVLQHPGVWQAAAAGVFMGVAQITFFRAMNAGPVGLVSAIGSVYPLITLVIGSIFLGLDINQLQALGIVMVVGGVMLASGLLDSRVANKKLGTGPLLAIIPACGWGIGWLFVFQAIAQIGWETTFLIEMLVTPVVIASLALLVKGTGRLNISATKAHWKMPELWLVAVLQMFALLAINVGISKLPDSTVVVVALSSCYPVLTIFLALRHLQERIPVIPLIGGVLGVLGVVVLSIG